MAITRYESYYGKIREQVKKIRNENEYNTNSLAFAHWYLDKYYKLSEQQIAEAIIDGSDDLGIDAVIIDENNKSLTVMQFKFPSKNTTINCEIEQGDILKTINGFKTIIKNDIDYTGKALLQIVILWRIMWMSFIKKREVVWMWNIMIGMQ